MYADIGFMICLAGSIISIFFIGFYAHRSESMGDTVVVLIMFGMTTMLFAQINVKPNVKNLTPEQISDKMVIAPDGDLMFRQRALLINRIAFTCEGKSVKDGQLSIEDYKKIKASCEVARKRIDTASKGEHHSLVSAAKIDTSRSNFISVRSENGSEICLLREDQSRLDVPYTAEPWPGMKIQDFEQAMPACRSVMNDLVKAADHT